MKSLLRRTGLDRSPPFYKDPLFILALIAGILFWVALSLFAGARPMPVHGLLSRRYLFLVLFQPAVEELLFRGFLQGRWLQSRWGRSSLLGFTAANLAASLLFAVSHLFSHRVEWAAAVFLPSLLFGYFRDRYDSLYPSILLHIFYNAGYFYLTGLP